MPARPLRLCDSSSLPESVDLGVSRVRAYTRAGAARRITSRLSCPAMRGRGRARLLGVAIAGAAALIMAAPAAATPTCPGADRSLCGGGVIPQPHPPPGFPTSNEGIGAKPRSSPAATPAGGRRGAVPRGGNIPPRQTAAGHDLTREWRVVGFQTPLTSPMVAPKTRGIVRAHGNRLHRRRGIHFAYGI